MKFSAQEEYGLRCMVALAREGEDGFLTIPAIASAEGLTESHVAKLLAILRKSDFVTSRRGQLGGYSLSRPAKEIIIMDVMEVLGGKLFEQEYCDRYTGVNDECVHYCQCSLRPLWVKIQAAVDGVISNVSLYDLAHGEAVSHVDIFPEVPQRVAAGRTS